MLNWVKLYNAEINKENPDQGSLTELQQSIQAVTKMQINSVDELNRKAEEAKQSLSTFHDACKKNQNTLQGESNTMKTLLDGEDGEIRQLSDDINECLKDIQTFQAEVDQGELFDCAPPSA
jgi:uncharacterized coiled-coil DUF342 family protein